MKRLIQKTTNPERHWVGDGFPVRTIFTYNDLGRELSPFLLMDYAGPHDFSPTDKRRGVGEHPHRGFETVTIIYDGEVEHRDSAGGGGLIKAGDVQWMTAASGLVHEEHHGHDFAKAGGRFEMVQLWVNLPAQDKRAPPRYQGLLHDQIPRVDLAGGGYLRVIAGSYQGETGPAKTFTPINLWDIRLQSEKVELSVPAGHTAAVFVLQGEVRLTDGEVLTEGTLGVLQPEGELFTLDPLTTSKILFLGGEPIAEPIVGYGPFVMNSVAEIQQAVLDFNAGRMGRLTSPPT